MSPGFFTRAFDYAPFNIESGPEFLLVYGVVGMVGLLAAKATQAVVMGALDSPRPPPKDGPPSLSASPMRRPPAHQRLTVGHYPRRDEILEVAYLRNGVDGIVDALLARAAAEGWITGSAGGALEVNCLSPQVTADSRELAAVLPYGPTTVANARSIARDLAKRHEETMKDRLLAEGLLRPPARLLVGQVAYWAVVLFTLGVGVIRLLRGLELDRPIWFLAFMLLIVSSSSLGFARSRRATNEAQRYLDWLNGATISVREAVKTHSAQPDDVALTGALVGVGIVPAFALAGIAVGGASGSSGSSCGSSSSCGGGGGCGSSCGGGGGCGG